MRLASSLAIAAAGLIGAAAPAIFVQAAEPANADDFRRRHAGGAVSRRSTALFEQRDTQTSTVQAQFGGSVKMAKPDHRHSTRPADLLAVADYNVIPKYLFAQAGRPGYATWYAGFARNAITFVYTDKSKFAARDQRRQNWYTRAGAARRRDRPLQPGHRPVRLSDRADARAWRRAITMRPASSRQRS